MLDLINLILSFLPSDRAIMLENKLRSTLNRDWESSKKTFRSTSIFNEFTFWMSFDAECSEGVQIFVRTRPGAMKRTIVDVLWGNATKILRVPTVLLHDQEQIIRNIVYTQEWGLNGDHDTRFYNPESTLFYGLLSEWRYLQRDGSTLAPASRSKIKQFISVLVNQ